MTPPPESTPADTPESAPRDFIRQIIDEDQRTGKHEGRVQTRFPPEPNGYLHIGHAKAICVSFGIAEEYGGKCNLRFDDTNPEKEDTEYVESIQRDIQWLGFQWDGDVKFTSDYFQQLYEWAVLLIRKGVAYVDHQTAEEIRKTRGSTREPGTNSPYRDRSVEENLELFEKMKNGEFDEGECVLRAKIDMTSPNMNMRDPAMYRIRKAHHHRTGDQWCIYPMYDWAHGQSDSIEKITHSLCSLEFEHHRPLYDWCLEQIDTFRSRQIEFARLNLNYTVMSKRKLLKLVEQGLVAGWDDPRMPTLSGMRRRGYPPQAIRAFCERIGLAKYNAVHELGLLEFSVREELNKVALRRMAVLDPLEVVIDNWPEGEVMWLDAVNNPEDESAGKRKVPCSGRLYIERDDFMEDPPKKFFRLGPDREVRLRAAFFLKCQSFEKDADGNVVRLRCTYDPETIGQNPPDGRKVKGTIHWVSADHAVDAEVRQYATLFDKEAPEDVAEGEDFTVNLNPESLTLAPSAKLEPALADANVEEAVQFERLGYFAKDPDSSADRLVFNRTVTLKDSWAKQKRKG